ncbi:MAG: right-handed parallel beta-helix repeat-containing protein [Bacteroidales bacterium]|nr:right-handed parallel beta-helix repeat-containing protein [Bacteroidales bacterium]
MKAKKLLIFLNAVCSLTCVATVGLSQSQIQITGLAGDNQGMAFWNTAGVGAEPMASGHVIPWAGYGEMPYYGASRDYILPEGSKDPDLPAGFHFTGEMTGFPLFSAALNAAGYFPEDVTTICGLSSLGSDIGGDDWFVLGNSHYTNYYGMNCTFMLSGYPLFTCVFPYQVAYFSIGDYLTQWESSFARVSIAQVSVPPSISEIAEAFILDVGNREIRLRMQLTPVGEFLFENGRRGIYCNTSGILETGKPKLALSGLLDEHLGFAAWNADGSGPEPKRTGHALPECQAFYYLASRDYDQIDPDPEAGLAGIVGEGTDGFFNLKLQLAYRGFSFDKLALSMDLSDIEEDIESEDWSITGDFNSSNYYHSRIRVRLNGQPLFGLVFDTLFTVINLSESTPSRSIGSSMAYVYDASAESSYGVRMVAKSLFRDLAERQMAVDIVSSMASAGIINEEGRCGAFWQVNEGELSAADGPGTIIAEGDVAGTWGAAGHPYYIKGEVTIPDGQTLIIEPGVWVKFTDRYRFNVKGRILAEGTGENTGGIVFTAANPDRGWGHLVMDDIANTNGQSRLVNCLFEKGFAAVEPEVKGSGAVSIRNSNNIVISHCIFRENEGRIEIGQRPNGGAIGMSNSSPFISHSVFYGNKAMYGGAIDMDQNSSPAINRCLFYDNEAVVCGGALVINKQSNPTLINNTMVNNSTHHFGGGIIAADNSNPVLVNNLLWGNTAPVGSQISVKTADCNVFMSYCDVQYGLKDIQPYGIGNGTFTECFITDPLFIDAPADIFMLDSIRPSVCIDAGDPYLPPDPDGSRSDIGVYCQTIAGITTSQPIAFREVKFSPNPFTDFTSITFALPENTRAEVDIYNALGNRVAKPEIMPGVPGEYRLVWKAGGFPEGIYMIRIRCGNDEIIRKVLKVH